MRITKYCLQTQKQGIDIKIAVVADLHAKKTATVIDALNRIAPDIILSPGDMFECFENKNDKININGFSFFEQATKIAPVFYCLGNHETEGKPNTAYPEVAGYKSIPPYVIEKLQHMSVNCIFDTHLTPKNNIAVGGLVSALHRDNGTISAEFLEKFEKLREYKILLCHHPEYYDKYLRDLDIDLIISGHAHGGQWNLFGRGVFAPGQGIFPKYTNGIHDGRFIISRGCSNNTRPIPVPRFFNPREVLYIKISSI